MSTGPSQSHIRFPPTRSLNAVSRLTVFGQHPLKLFPYRPKAAKTGHVLKKRPQRSIVSERAETTALNRMRLQEEVSELLFREWDPIGVNVYEGCRDEYDSYVPAICRLLLEGADEYRLAAHLEQLACVNMGLSPNPERSRQAAQRLLELIDHPSSSETSA